MSGKNSKGTQSQDSPVCEFCLQGLNQFLTMLGRSPLVPSVGGGKRTTEMYQSILYFLTSCKVYSKEQAHLRLRPTHRTINHFPSAHLITSLKAYVQRFPLCSTSCPAFKILKGKDQIEERSIRSRFMAGMLELTDWEFKTVNIWYAKGYNKLHAATDVTTKIVKKKCQR